MSVWQHTLGGQHAAARLFIGQQQWEHSSAQLLSCSADVLFILGMQYLSLGVLRHVLGVRHVVSILLIPLFC